MQEYLEFGHILLQVAWKALLYLQKLSILLSLHKKDLVNKIVHYVYEQKHF